MPKYNIIVDKSTFSNRVNESELVDNISKKEFFNILKENGYSKDLLADIFEEKRLSASEQFRFNNIIRKIKSDSNIPITESIIYLEESFVKFKKILSVFDSETKTLLKKELSKKFHIKLDENTLKQILG